MIGTIKFFNVEKGYGFIKPDDGSPDVFVHITAVDDANLETPQADDRVSYEMGTNKKTGQPKAINLRLAT